MQKPYVYNSLLSQPRTALLTSILTCPIDVHNLRSHVNPGNVALHLRRGGGDTIFQSIQMLVAF
jgi:hypothetical protein